MRVAIPITRDRRCGDLQDCEHLSVVAVDDGRRTIVDCRDLAPPPRRRGTMPRWLAEHGVGLLIAVSVDDAARLALRRSGIVVLSEAPPWPPERLVEDLLLGGIAPGARA